MKWFNATKGFGFVTLEDGSDAFCHASALSGVSSPDLPQGATIYCEVGQGQRGIQVTRVLSVEAPSDAPQGRGGPRPQRASRDAAPGPMGEGHVKFFNEQKGFGFVVPESGGADIYVHASALRRSGLSSLLPEQKVRFSTRQGTKGVEVDRIELT